MVVTKDAYTDQFFLTRRRAEMSVAAEIQWWLLPPLSMVVPQVEVAGVLEPAYEVAGDRFDYALNDNILHVGMIDAMGHGLDAATMAAVAIGAYRHARRAEIEPSEIYTLMDKAHRRTVRSRPLRHRADDVLEHLHGSAAMGQRRSSEVTVDL